jgi:hypothetical protein
MVQPETLKLAGLFILAAVGGKCVAAVVAKRPLHLTGSETLLMLGLTIPQAAATLAATVVGFNIGLFDRSVVNAVLVLILVTIVVATLLVERVKTNVEVPDGKDRGVGRHVLVAIEHPGQAQLAFAVAASIASPDGGVVRGLLGCPPSARSTVASKLEQLRNVGHANGVDTDPSMLVDNSFADGVVNSVVEHEPSLVLIGNGTPWAPTGDSSGEAVAGSITDPVALLIGEVDEIRGVVLVESPSTEDGAIPSDGARIAKEIATRVGGKVITVLRQDADTAFADLSPGQVGVTAIDSSRVLRGRRDLNHAHAAVDSE